MDLLTEMYASPFLLLDEVIRNEQFSEWVDMFLNKLNKKQQEKNDQMLWEYYLHKVYDKSFNDFKASIGADIGTGQPSNNVMDEAKKQDIVKKSEDILNSFHPE